jgi:transposase
VEQPAEHPRQACAAGFPHPLPLHPDGVADSVYTGERLAKATTIAIEIVRRLPDQVDFQVLPRRWVVEHFLDWVDRNRGLTKDFEGTIASADAFHYAASVMLLARRLTRSVWDSSRTL